MLAAMRLEPFVFQCAAAELLRSDDFVEQAVHILRVKYGNWFWDGLYRTGCRSTHGFEYQLVILQKAALVRSGTALSDWPARAEVKQLLASKGLSSPLEGDCRPCSCCARYRARVGPRVRGRQLGRGAPAEKPAAEVS